MDAWTDGRVDGWMGGRMDHPPQQEGVVSKVVSRAADLGFPEAITFMKCQDRCLC